MNPKAAKYLIDGSVIIGIKDRNIETHKMKIGIIVGTRYGLGVSGCVLRRINNPVIHAPYVTQMRKDANSINAVMLPTTMNTKMMTPWNRVISYRRTVHR